MTDSATHPCTDSSQPKKKAGRRVGSKGYSRNLTLAVTRTVPHRPVCCSLCGQATVYQLLSCWRKFWILRGNLCV